LRKVANLMKEFLIEKRNIILILGGLVALLGIYVIQMLNQLDLETLQNIFAQFPEGFIDFFGGIFVMANPYGFLSLELFSFIWLYIGVYVIYLASNILPQEIEQRSIDLILSKPIKRSSFLIGKILNVYIFIFFTLGIVFLVLFAVIPNSQVFKDYGIYYDRIFGTFLLTVLFLGSLAAIPILTSNITLNSKKAIGIGIGFLFLMFFIGNLYNYFDESIQNIKYISVFFYYNPSDYLINWDLAQYWRDFAVLSIVNLSLIISSVLVFKRKDISI